MKKKVVVMMEEELIKLMDSVAKKTYRNRSQFLIDCVLKAITVEEADGGRN